MNRQIKEWLWYLAFPFFVGVVLAVLFLKTFVESLTFASEKLGTTEENRKGTKQ